MSERGPNLLLKGCTLLLELPDPPSGVFVGKTFLLFALRLLNLLQLKSTQDEIKLMRLHIRQGDEPFVKA